MFASLKNKIKEETGADIKASSGGPHHQRHLNNNRVRSRFSSTLSVNSSIGDDAGSGAPSSQQYQNNSDLRSQCNELTTKVADFASRIQTLQEEKSRVEKTNEILLETVKVAQTQKDLYCEEQEKIQNMQQSEIDKLKSLLSFREQEAVDRLAAMRQSQQQVENLTAQMERIKPYEPMIEDLQDKLERLRHSSQLDKNNLTTTLAAVEEENRHLKMRLQIIEEARLETISTLNSDEKLQALVRERKLLEQHLEEAHLQLSDIKGSWSGQNLALETQLSRLSKQVAEETTEKRKALKARDDLIEKVKQLDFEMLKSDSEILQRDDKVKLLEDEIDELSLALKECREESEQQIIFERNKAKSLETERNDLQTRLNANDERFGEYAANAEHVAQSLRQQNAQLQEQLGNTQGKFELEKEEKLTALLRNAEISQSQEILKKELRIERDELNEMHEKYARLQTEVRAKQQELVDCRLELTTVRHNSEHKLKEIDEMQREISEKNKTIIMLNQRLADLKKTLQKEFRSTKSFDANSSAEQDWVNGASSGACFNCASALAGGIVMDEVNFKYLKHVVVKFLTSREVEARHLIRAVATLLKLSKEEEKLLHDTLNWKMSWFGSKPDHGSGQRAVAIPPS